jgi:hypothetical protein
MFQPTTLGLGAGLAPLRADLSFIMVKRPDRSIQSGFWVSFWWGGLL